MFLFGCDVEENLFLTLVVWINDWTHPALEGTIGSLVQLEVRQGVENAALEAHSLHLYCVLAQFGGHDQTVHSFSRATQSLYFSEAVVARVGCDGSLLGFVGVEFIDLSE